MFGFFGNRLGICRNGVWTHGYWNKKEQNLHINYLELQSALFGLKCFTKNLANCDVSLRIDNTTAIAYITQMGDIQIRDFSKWMDGGIYGLSRRTYRQKTNTADFESRRLKPETESELSNTAFRVIRRRLRKQTTDLFATRVSSKCTKCISCLIDPKSWAANAFTIN